ncbi:MAG: helix-turn-helix domain-containing protein [Flavobacteriales bacterium]|nr:helix-turn-helix domain-containing protein [Flavobacteriales bacterium]
MDDITERVKKVMEDNGLSSSQMADRIGVQRSAISHILSGRNKPSLDFVLKVLDAFKELSSDWLLKGVNEGVKSPILNPENRSNLDVKTAPKKTIEKVLILYSDKTVEEYHSH